MQGGECSWSVCVLDMARFYVHWLAVATKELGVAALLA